MPLGLGGLSSILAASLGRYRLLFTVAALILLGFGHYLIFRKKKPTVADRVILWTTTAVVILVLVLF